MDEELLVKTINFANHEFSLLLVNPKPNLFDWLNMFIKRKGLERYRLYSEEENTVLIIPKVDYFSEPSSFKKFVDKMKPKLLHAELSRFHAKPEDFGHPITKESFDMFFEISVRDCAYLMSDLKYGDI